VLDMTDARRGAWDNRRVRVWPRPVADQGRDAGSEGQGPVARQEAEAQPASGSPPVSLMAAGEHSTPRSRLICSGSAAPRSTERLSAARTPPQHEGL